MARKNTIDYFARAIMDLYGAKELGGQAFMEEELRYLLRNDSDDLGTDGFSARTIRRIVEKARLLKAGRERLPRSVTDRCLSR